MRRLTNSEAPPFQRVGMLAELPDSVLVKLAAACRWEEYSRNEQIIGVQDDEDDVLVVHSGRVRTWACSPEGKAVIYREIGAGDVVGEFAAIDGRSRSADVVALEKVSVARLPGTTYLDLLAQEPALMLAQLQSLTRNIRGLTERIYQGAALSVPGRIQVFLLNQAQTHRHHDAGRLTAVIKIPKQSDLAAHIGTHREAVSRELNRLEKVGVLERSGNKLTVDISRLESEVGVV